MSFRMWLVSTLAISMATISGQARGDTPAAKKPDTTGNAQVTELPAFTPDREAAALEFVAAPEGDGGQGRVGGGQGGTRHAAIVLRFSRIPSFA